MRWMTKIVMLSAKLTFYVVILSWVFVGSLKSQNAAHAAVSGKGSKSVPAETSRRDGQSA